MKGRREQRGPYQAKTSVSCLVHPSVDLGVSGTMFILRSSECNVQLDYNGWEKVNSPAASFLVLAHPLPLLPRDWDDSFSSCIWNWNSAAHSAIQVRGCDLDCRMCCRVRGRDAAAETKHTSQFPLPRTRPR
ncbi:hypothetical protein Mp_1g26140 [Marchantia polymorpha subsp. ruderalis]|uniref:Uncharacterized protein n=2 Tax=Marchantia polymorpha TaxID=3197 RepID=A0AAF6AUF0_MARPO|nr:hypothetical protein MARPO_0002s0263 [Marchantia polymorpha]BBN00071.1 hypothetical protein Mp_1g26140 [Marchantia polymorpha subsp. ruderalis]|eukprot:PTQ49813.1 hypothetical protein MARPO_0002s0263 [Marchantia polymorpha]